MTPLGHAAISHVLGCALPRWPMWGFVIGGVIPDVDFALLPLESFNSIHRAATHNVFFISLVALACAALWRRRAAADRARIAAAALTGGALHLFIDSVMDANGSNGVGVAAFWPASNQLFSPFNLLDPAIMSAGWSDLSGGFRALKYELPWELPFYLASAALLIRAAVISRRNRTSASYLPSAPTTSDLPGGSSRTAT